MYRKPATKLVDSCIDKLGLAEEKPKFDLDLLSMVPLSTQRWRALNPSPSELIIQQFEIEKCVAAQLSFPVQFQFVLTADKNSFEIGYFDETLFKSNGQSDTDRVLAFIYQ